MTIQRVGSRWLTVAALALLSLSLTGCVARLGTGWAGITVLDDGTSLAIAYEDTIRLVNVATGDPIPLLDGDDQPLLDEGGSPVEWRVRGRDLDNAQFFAAPVQLNDETLLATTIDRRLLRIDRDNSGVINTQAVPIEGRGNAVTTPVLADGQLLVGLQDRFVAIDIETYAPNWEIEVNHAVWAEPLVIDDVVYFVALDHQVRAVTLETGDEIWSVDVGGAVASKPTYNPDLETLYVGTFNSEVVQLDVSDGTILNRYQTDEWVWGEPVLADGMLYVADLDGVVYKLDAQTLTEGDNGWYSQFANGALRTPPLVFGDFVVVGSRDQHVYWLNRDTGNVIFDRRLDGEVLADLMYFPADEEKGIEVDLVVVSTLSNSDPLVAFEATTGERVWPS